MAIGTQAYVIRNGERMPVDIPEHAYTLYRKTVPTLAVPMNEPFIVDTLEGKEMAGVPGDFLCKGAAGELYPCDGDIFRATHEQHSTALSDTIMEFYAGTVEDGETPEQTAIRILRMGSVYAVVQKEGTG
jgi:hypothetical protein